MRPVIVFSIVYLLFVININGDKILNEKIFYPPYWHLAPSSLSEFPLINDSISSYRLIDPWYYPHRLGLYKILINITTPFMPFCSTSNASNILFAVPSQFGWLFNSDRLFTNDTMNISTNSWWASANYYLSVIPFLVAVDIGLIIPQEPFRIIQYENFCSNSDECLHQIPNATAQWHIFFLRLQQSSSCVGHNKIDGYIIDKCYLKEIWLAYKSSIYNSLPLVESKLHYLPSDVEKYFGLAWARLINLISMTRKNTNLYETRQNQQKFLPFRMLKESDQGSNSNDLPDTVKKSLKILFMLDFNRLPFLEQIWKRITCNYQSRVYAQHTLDTMAISRLVALHYLAKAIINAFLHQCDSDYV
jgi:hypothetical protein